MPIEQNKGLRGLPGLNNISEQERQAFMLNNAEKLKQYRSPGKRKQAAEILYNNQQFINKFGQDAFDKLNDGTQSSYNYRNSLLKEKVVDDAFKDTYSPFDVNGKRNNNKGFGKDWEKYYNDLSTDAKIDLLNSEWKTPEQLKKEQNERTAWWQKGIDFVAGEAIQQYKKDSNQKILDRIYSNDADNAAKKYNELISKAYLDPEITGRNDTETKKMFIEAITPNYAKGNMGIAEYASHYGKGTSNDITSEMEDFSIDDMRQVLAKKAVYDVNMSPEMAATALNNEAKRYIKQHQGSLKRFGLFAKDVGISALSYTADKVNSLYDLGLMVADRMGNKPVVYVDDQGTVLDTNKTRIIRGKDGKLRYQDENGNTHFVHQQEMDRTTLHNMGKNMDGSDDESLLNPIYWTRAEQFGTLDEDLQKQYEKLGSSPYKVVYDPNEDTDLVYESFKMMSFGIADAASMLIPFGIGATGRALSTAGKLGKVGKTLGKAMDYTGKALGAETRFGQVTQGLVGAGGIAYAYQRGAFQETLAQNLANAEESLKNASQKDIFNQYHSDNNYKQQVDSLINKRAAAMKAEYIANLGEGGANQIVDEKALDNMIHAKAQDAVLGELTQEKMNEKRGTKEYAQLQQEAINSAGDAAIRTFLPEAIKYGVVNTVGFRKFLYSHPTSLAQKAARNFEGITEKTLENGQKRLAVASKFATRGEKMKQFGKVLGSQMWGGAWTNGTDDMMVDAAERINSDSFGRYLNAYENGESMANLYGFTDGIYSYFKGLQNSLGQETTWNAATVGGFGSIVSASPHMANIAHLMTKEGRDAYKNNFQQRYTRNEDGTIKRGEDGQPIMEQLKWADNIGERLGFFIQNGVLNTYYGKQQGERNLQAHADYVNDILDKYEDFKVLEELIASDIASENAEAVGDKKTIRFVKAINTINALNHLAQNADDPAAMSSVVNSTKELIGKLSNLDTNEGSELSEEEVDNLLSQYYSQHPGIEQSEETAQIALQEISSNARKLQEASEAYDAAEESIQKIESSLGRTIDPFVRNKLKMSQALNGHWRERRDKMREEIGDISDVDSNISEDNLIPSIGGKKNAETLVKVYDKQKEELNKELSKQQEEINKVKEKYDKAVQERKDAKDSDEIYDKQSKLDEAKAEYDNAIQQKNYLEELISKTDIKQKAIKNALNKHIDEASDKILSADELFSLDPVSRARILNKENRGLYSKDQQAEIVKLEQRLRMERGEDSLEKIQDIARLTQRIQTNEEAFSKMAENPEAAAVAFEAQREMSTDAAYKLINQRNADTIVDYINQVTEGLKSRDDISQDFIDNSVYQILRKHHPKLLDIIEKDGTLSQWQKQLSDAKAWAEVTEDIANVIEHLEGTKEWKANLSKNIINIIDTAESKEGIMANLEKVIDDVDNPQVADDFEKVLNGLEKLNYQRDATIIEEREKRKEREKVAKEKLEEEQRKAKEAAEEAAKRAVEDSIKAEAAKKAAEEEERKNAEVDHDIKPDGSGIVSIDTSTIVDQGLDTAVQKGELSPWANFASFLMDDEAENGEVEVGEIWYDSESPKKGILKVKKINDTISFNINDNVPFNFVITGSDWNKPKDGESLSKDVSFTVRNIKKRGNEWHFIGKFADDKSPVSLELPVSKTFNLDETLQEAINKREAEFASKGVDVNNLHLIDEGEYIRAESPTINEQAQFEKEGVVTNEENDPNDINESIEDINKTRINTLNANSMAKYNYYLLRDDHILQIKVGNRADDSRNRYNTWMDTFVDANGVTGTDVQNIIDTELHQIVAQNPHTKVRFMAVRPEHNATNDYYMQTHLMLVIDYTDEVADIHNKNNGGVIESEGKKYLIIGTAGYGDIKTDNPEQLDINKNKQNLYDVLFAPNKGASSTGEIGILMKARASYFNSHNGKDGSTYERFYIHPSFETEIVPNSIVPGYLVKQTIDDTNEEHRPVTELLKSERNPDGLPNIEAFKWGIQEITQFLPIKERLENIMVPRNNLSNSGTVFLLIPAANGKMFPVHIDPLRWQEMKNGALKDRVSNLLIKLTAPGTQNYGVRYSALEQLLQIFYFNKDGNNILLGKKGRNTIGLVKQGKSRPFAEFKLDDNFDFQKFTEAFGEMNPRVNVTRSVLIDRVLLNQYAEAGALNTDCAYLRTVGSSYSIYAVNAQGKMLNDIPAPQSQRATDNDFRNSNHVQVYFKGMPYRFDNIKGVYTLDGKIITDDAIIKQLDYNKKVVMGELTTSKSSTLWDYYILSTGEHPLVIKIHKNDRSVVEATEEKSREFIEKIKKEEENKRREIAAQEALKKGPVKKEDVDLGDAVQDNNINELIELYELYASLGTEDIQGKLNDIGYQMVEIKEAERIFNQKHPDGIAQITEEEAKEIAAQLGINDYNQEKKKEEEEETPARQQRQDRDYYADKSVEGRSSYKATSPVQTIESLIKDRNYKYDIFKAMSDKWADSPVKMDKDGIITKSASRKEIREFLEKNKIEVDAIGTSNADIQTWITTLKECR